MAIVNLTAEENQVDLIERGINRALRRWRGVNGIRVIEDDGDVVISLMGGRGLNTPIGLPVRPLTRVRFKSLHSYDVAVVVPWDGTDEGDEFKAALSFMARKTGNNESDFTYGTVASHSRTYHEGQADEQDLTLRAGHNALVVDSEHLVAYPEGGTGITDPDDTSDTPGELQAMIGLDPLWFWGRTCGTE